MGIILNRLKTTFLPLLLIVPVTSVIITATGVGTVYAGTPSSSSSSASCPSGSSAKAQVLQGLGATGSDCSGKQVNSLFAVVVNILSMIVGVLAIIVILVSGFKYMTSSGDQNKVANAKGTLIYALIGLAVAALAQLLVHLVLYQTTSLGQ